MRVNNIELSTNRTIERIVREFGDDRPNELRKSLYSLVEHAESDINNQFNACVADLRVARSRFLKSVDEAT